MKILFTYFLVIAMSCTTLLGNVATIENTTNNTGRENPEKIEQAIEGPKINNKQEEIENIPETFIFHFITIITSEIENSTEQLDNEIGQFYEKYEEINKEELFNYLKNIINKYTEIINSIGQNQPERKITEQIQKLKSEIFNPNFSHKLTKKLGFMLLRSLLESIAHQATIGDEVKQIADQYDKFIEGYNGSGSSLQEIDAEFADQLVYDEAVFEKEDSFQDQLEEIIGKENANEIKNLHVNLIEKAGEDIVLYAVPLIEAFFEIILPTPLLNAAYGTQESEEANIINGILMRIKYIADEHFTYHETPTDSENCDPFTKTCKFVKDKLFTLSDDELLMFFNHNNQSENAKEFRFKLLKEYDEMLNNFELQPIFVE